MCAIRTIKLANHYNLDTFLTITMEIKLDEATRVKCMQYSNDSQATATHEELLKFLDLQAQHYESVPLERKPQTVTHRSYATTVEEECDVCCRESHPFASCSQLRRMTCEERWGMVKKGGNSRSLLWKSIVSRIYDGMRTVKGCM